MRPFCCRGTGVVGRQGEHLMERSKPLLKLARRSRMMPGEFLGAGI